MGAPDGSASTGSSAHDGREGAGNHRLLCWYPAAYRERYGDELSALIEDELGAHPRSVRIRLDVARAGAGERLRAGGLIGGHVPAAERARANALVVLCAWALCTVAGAALAKYAEHWDAGLTWPAKRVSEAGYDAVSVAAVVGGAAVAAAGLVCLGPLLSWWRQGGARTVARQLWGAGVSSAVALALFAAVLVVRPGSSGVGGPGTGGRGTLYGLGLAWVVSGVVALAAVTRAGVAIARRLTITRRRLRVLVALAGVVSTAMTAVLAGTALWWGAMPAPGRDVVVLGPRLAVGTLRVDLVVVAILAAMVLAALIGATGAVRSVTALRREATPPL